MTATTPDLANAAPPLYRFIPELSDRQLHQLVQYLTDCHVRLPYLSLTETWDYGIGLAREEMQRRGILFVTIRAGYPPVPLAGSGMPDRRDHELRR